MNVIEEIIEFCSQENSIGALLLTGNWGCGKTYLINNILDKDIKFNNKFVIVRVSLFGLANYKSVNLKVKREYFFKKFPNQAAKTVNMISKLVSVFVKGTEKVVKEAGAAIPFLTTDWLEFVKIKDINKKKVVLVFDDLERCSMGIQEILGCLNEYVENQKIKAIVIADEEKIQAVQELNTKENKEEEKKENQEVKNKCGMQYKQLKEKLISRTIKYSPNHTKIVDTLIQSYIETAKGFKIFLSSYAKEITNIFKSSETDNIRSLKCAIQDGERFYKSIIEYEFAENAIKHFILSFIIMVFENKAGKLSPGKYGYLFVDDAMSKKHSNYDSYYVLEPIRQWIKEGEWDQRRIDSALKEKEIAVSKEEPKDVLLHSDLFDVDENILKNGYPVAVEDAYRGNLTFEEYIGLISISYTTKLHDINLPTSIDLDKVLSGIQLRIERIKKGDIILSNDHLEITKDMFEELNAKEQRIINEIRDYRNKHIYFEDRNQLLCAIESKKFEDIMNCFDTNIQYFDTELAVKVFEYYRTLRNAERRVFARRLLKKLTPNQALSRTDINNTINGLKHFKNLLNRNPSSDQITNAIDRNAAESVEKNINDLKEFLSTYTDEKYTPPLLEIKQ